MGSLEVFALKVKIATLIPTGTNWAKTLKDMSKEIKKVTNGKVKFQIYYDGVQGDEPDVLRKTRVGQVHGGVFTGKTLGDIYSDIRILEVPFNFYHNEEKAYQLLSKNNDSFNAEFEKAGFVNLGYYGLGKVFIASTKKVSTLSEMKGVKMWAWEGDEIVQAMMKSLELVSVPLALPDVMSSLSTGMIDSAYAPPLGILALQWQNKVKYIVDFPIAYSIGALLITKKQWKKISPEHQGIIKTIAKKHIAKANKLATEDNLKSIETLKSLGIEFVQFNKSDLKKAEDIRKDVLTKLKGSVLSEQAIQLLEAGR